jgi:two-component system, NarL family, nitrate/nitrite response regulator NarL
VTLVMSDLSLVIVDDHPLFRDGVAAALQSEPDLNVLAQGENAAQALELAQKHLPDIILLDITMPGGGIEAAKAITAACPVTKIIMLTFSEEEDDVLAALKAGAKAYVLKGVGSRDLKNIIRSVGDGQVYITPTLAAGMLRELSAPASAERPHNPLDELTERELGILHLLAAGKSNKAIGKELGLTEKTIKHYMSNILQKLQVRNRVEAAILAQKYSKAGDRR